MMKRFRNSAAFKTMANNNFVRTLLFTLFIPNVVTASPLLSHETEVRFGVLANKGVENALERWNPTADYLNQQLPEIAQVVTEAIRKYDIFARWGGEEFMVLVPNSKAEETALMAKKIRERIEKYAFTEAGTVTCSFGVTEYRDGDSIDSLVTRADQSLYKAKEQGRNRVEIS
jgi:glycine cleavage system pyridoxal-binding protein P